MATKRLYKEFRDISTNPPQGISAGPIDDDLLHWEAVISGPDRSPYAGGLFYVKIRFPENYPFRAPKFDIPTRIYHPHMDWCNGRICECHMRFDWSPASTISKMLLSISELLTSPNPDCRMNGEAANLYKLDRRKYNETAAEWTRKYAM
ncbi:ubiquitin-conjugating enzyme E2 D2B-like [Mytilus galloprovincialis]|uniref:ubiquitin-conjugating enzyme E2 D2B-like n=1 Tax=Mytilus galloprovincialis TaxID=29158 RepID=UPI003F7C0183